MSIHSIAILANKKQYVNIPTDLITKIRQLFGAHLAAAWEVFYTESRRTHGVLRKTYDYLALKMGCSRKTVMRYAKRLSEAGVLIINRRFHHDCPIENEFILLTPEEALVAAKEAEDRMSSVEIDYSVDYLVENSNSVDKSVPFWDYSITDLNTDINTEDHSRFSIRDSRITEPKTAIAAYRQEEKPRGQQGKYLDGSGSMSKIAKTLESIRAKIQNRGNSIHCEPQKILNDPNSKLRPSELDKTPDLGADVNLAHQINTPKSVSQSVVRKIEKIVRGIPGISNPSGLVQEAIHFVANRKEGFGEWRAVGAFAKLLGKNGCGPWRTPFSMRTKEAALLHQVEIDNS